MRALSHPGRIFLWVLTIIIMTFGAPIWLQGCSCGDKPVVTPDSGPVPEKVAEGPKFPSKTQIRFIKPIAQDTVSGQITIEAEVLDADGMKEVGFWINNKFITSAVNPKRSSPPNSPRYEAQIATHFLQRGVLSLTVRTEDQTGEFAEKTIQVKTRERWAVPFGAGKVKQMFVSNKRHVYARIYRTQEDLNSFEKLGPYDKVGSAILTASPVGGVSWVYLGFGESFSPFVMDDKGNMYFSSKNNQSGYARFISLGPGQSNWSSSVKAQPRWEKPIEKFRVRGTPVVEGKHVWILMEKDAVAGQPSTSAIACFQTEDGTELWQFAGEGSEKIEIMRGPYSVGNGEVLIFTRPPGTTEQIVTARILAPDGKQVWKKKYTSLALTVVAHDPQSKAVYLGIQRWNKDNKVESSAVVYLDTKKRTETWRYELGKSWSDRLVIGKQNLFIRRRPKDGTYEFAAVTRDKGKFVWKMPFTRNREMEILPAKDDQFFIRGIQNNDEHEPGNMLVHKYDAKGKKLWEFSHNNFAPKNWLYIPLQQDMLWLIVRNLKDKSLQLGTRVLALDKAGKRQYIFGEEARHFEYFDFVAPDHLYVSSFDPLRDARIHNLLPR